MSPHLIQSLLESLSETLIMVGASSLLATVFGVPLGVLLLVTGKGQILERPLFNKVAGAIVNATRSTPFIILMVAIIPLTRLIVGTSIGTAAATVPLVIAAVPFVARLVEASLREVDTGLVEAAQAMGASPGQIITKVMLPEAMPGITAGLTITVVSLIGYSAMAGAVGGGGLGDLGIRYGYQRFQAEVMVAVVVVLIALVTVVQAAGDRLATRLNKRVVRQGPRL
ncbi:methionine ABC transporter permease [Rhodospirillum rubrum]|uniref:Binding-protein-dependent transport systems inner membrane component n=1 Tax=Rhodospirillum rubrum (strain ATCC 11170 / ATH 1.1.1 / DSM 467 / LMG 4362 / NCIMB 8255 / S1) TaxID=269796 RepID=Q2RWA2_RHORT|nr:methionine ABC transporter permease [Rhodospirillum rubrum]ABC21593.1 Binding-protein-dependent transport systems inner membrane component [Rhodospirillum rubrum ATCC 11170]AEO47279.1 binding-protein dependent transport system inner membrane protein [Rhodospirillum rubrum F11]MBK5955795.1 methionine ABC transporter permease [Rhodospirillum rubrum]QXG81263.1 ABC transporter permease [Rhodospirillum rubrum]HCF19458.1 ABC transporter permease [Rhodospirillum rubrum]